MLQLAGVKMVTERGTEGLQELGEENRRNIGTCDLRVGGRCTRGKRRDEGGGKYRRERRGTHDRRRGKNRRRNRGKREGSRRREDRGKREGDAQQGANRSTRNRISDRIRSIHGEKSAFSSENSWN